MVQSPPSQGNSNLITTGLGAEDCMEFAPQTPNPYSIPNMQSALQLLIDSSEFICDYTKVIVRPTHKYIKFKPVDSTQYTDLNNDSSLILFDFPLDRKLTKGGTYYRDPNVPEGQPNYQWCAVPFNKVLPSGIPYDMISELYLPEQDPNLVEYYNTPFDGCINLLIEQALLQTGNQDTSQHIENYTHVDPTAKFKIKLPSLPAKWAPKGTIKIYDDILNTKIGLEGAKVRAHRWFEIRESLTNANGFYDMGQEFRYPVDYTIKWERADFHIRSGTFGQAYFNGPHQQGDWNLDLEKNGFSWVFGNVHRAALRYYYGNTGGIKRPGEKNLRFWIYNRKKDVVADAGYEKIRMWRYKSNNSPYSSDELYSTACHEMGHMSHRKLMTSQISFNSVMDLIPESYSISVEWVLTQLEYRSRGITNFSGPTYYSTSLYPTKYAYQYWDKYNDNQVYTPLFIDLIDDFNQDGMFLGSMVNDQVNKFELKEIEKIMKNVKDLGDLKNQLQSIKPSGVTNTQISDLIDQYQ